MWWGCRLYIVQRFYGETEPISKHFLTFWIAPIWVSLCHVFPLLSEPDPFYQLPVFLYVCFCCKVWHFDMDFYGDWLTLKSSLKVPIEEVKFFIPLDGFTYKPQRLPLDPNINMTWPNMKYIFLDLFIFTLTEEISWGITSYVRRE